MTHELLQQLREVALTATSETLSEIIADMDYGAWIELESMVSGSHDESDIRLAQAIDDVHLLEFIQDNCTVGGY